MTETLGRRLASLSPDRIQALVRGLGATTEERPAFDRMPRNAAGRYPLSSAQERMWFLTQLAPGSAAFNNPGALRASRDTPLDAARLEAAVADVARRHEILRTTFHAENGQPWQFVHDELRPHFAWHDLRDLDPRERETAALALARSEGQRSFDLERGPLLAFVVARLGDLEYLLLITTHHIVSDGWSNAMLAQEIAGIYSAGENGVLPPASPALHYVDFVRWEADWLKGAVARDQLRRWKGRLAEDRGVLPLPLDRPRPEVLGYRGSLETDAVPAEITRRLRDLARRQKASLFHAVVAAFSLLLSRWTGENEIAIGTQTANRDMREFRNVFGLFANTVVLRTEIDGERSVADHLRACQAVCEDALRDQAFPFERLVGELNPQRTLNAHPIFQVMLVHQNVPTLYDVPGMRLRVLKVDYGVAKFDLNLWVEEIGDELALTLHYSTELFDRGTVRRILASFRALVAALVDAPDRPLDAVECFPPEPAARPAVPNGAPAAERSFHRRFEEQVRRTPAAPAVEGGDGTLSYAELNARANRLARLLVARGVAPGDCVALALPRSAAALVAILAVMKAGGAYVAIDAGAPPQRVAAIVADCGAVAFVTDRASAGIVAADVATRLVLEEVAAELALLAGDDLDIDAGPSALAYVVYTSGSTGAPKGVEVEHRHLGAYCDAVWPVLGLPPASRFASVTSLAADLANTMLFPPLLHGGTAVIVPEELVTDPAGLGLWLAARPVDSLKLVPSHLRALLQTGDPAALLPRRLLVLGGEASDWDLVASVRAQAPALRILNHYGPSETTVGVLAFEAGVTPPSGGGPLPLGFPLGAAEIDIRDRRGRPVPVGVVGEIWIGGPTVARGYRGRPDLTAQRFCPDPVRPGARLYRTGDRARRLADGSILFLGRTDSQLKIRGHRVELGEIEQALRRCAGVAGAVVLPPVSDDPRQTLTACVVAEAGASLDAESLARRLAASLPAHMVPGRYAFPAAMPLTANGKIDRRALAALAAAPAQRIAAPPRDALEVALVNLWREVLGLDAIGIDDAFFEIGGHSLLAVQMMAGIERRFGRRLSLATLFQHPTIRALADLIRTTAGAAVSDGALVPIQPGGSGRPCFFVHPAGGNVLCYYDLSRHLGGGVPFWGLQADAAVGEPSIAGLARSYLAALPPLAAGTVPLFGGWSMGALVAFEMARLHAAETGVLPIVAVLDQPAPESRAGDGDLDEVGRLALFARKASQLAGRDLGLTTDVLRDLSAEERAALFLERFKASQFAPESTSVADFARFLELMIEHNRMTVEYAGGSYAGRVIVCRAADRADAIDDEDGDDGALGWRRLAGGPVEVVAVPGTHVTMMRQPNVGALAAALAATAL